MGGIEMRIERREAVTSKKRRGRVDCLTISRSSRKSVFSYGRTLSQFWEVNKKCVGTQLCNIV
jgi:hypothetical protein